MLVRADRLRPPLGGFVECLWYLDNGASAHARERALPTGTVELVISLREEPFRIFSDDRDTRGQEFRRSVVCGAQSRYFVLDTSRPGPVVGVHFRPGGAAPFLGVPASEVMDRHVQLEDVWGASAHALRERLLAAESPAAMFLLLENALMARLKRPLLLHPAIANALQEFGACPALARIGEAQRESGYSPKRFIELFRNAVGLTPKRYCRIQRFQGVLAQLARGRKVEWAAVAADAGYADQSHLNRDFRDFAGTTPGDYRPVAEDRPSHVAIR